MYKVLVGALVGVTRPVTKSHYEYSVTTSSFAVCIALVPCMGGGTAVTVL